MSEGKHYGKKWGAKQDELEIKPVVVWVKFKPSVIVAIDKLVEVYGGSRAGMVTKIVLNFLELDDDKQRATLIAEELHRKKAEALIAKQNAEKEIERIEADMKRIGVVGVKP